MKRAMITLILTSLCLCLFSACGSDKKEYSKLPQPDLMEMITYDADGKEETHKMVSKGNEFYDDIYKAVSASWKVFEDGSKGKNYGTTTDMFTGQAGEDVNTDRIIFHYYTDILWEEEAVNEYIFIIDVNYAAKYFSETPYAILCKDGGYGSSAVLPQISDDYMGKCQKMIRKASPELVQAVYQGSPNRTVHPKVGEYSWRYGTSYIEDNTGFHL